jgi:Fe-S cluster biosynthesis and repair protein YggX
MMYDKDFKQKILGEWKRLIKMKEEDLKFYKKEKNNFMFELTEKVLKGMKNDYEKISKGIKTS